MVEVWTLVREGVPEPLPTPQADERSSEGERGRRRMN
jgi:hypothetical protein